MKHGRVACAAATRLARHSTLALVLVAMFMLVLDISVVTVALPAIRADLTASFDASQWVLDAYAIVLAALLLPAASLADLRGRKRVYMTGLAVFTAASAACALAPSILALAVARAVQGVGAASVFGAGLPLIAAAYPESRARSRAVAAFGATVAAGIAVGPFVGGAVTAAFGWQAVFLLNLPVGVAALTVASRRIAESAEATGRPIDFAGAALLCAALFALVCAIVRGNVVGWGAPPIVGGFVAAGALLVTFVVVERHRRFPMIDLGLLRSSAFRAAGLSVLALGALVGALVPLAAFLQDGLRHGALQTGIELLPISAMSFVAAATTGRVLVPRLGTRWVLGGALGLVATGLASMTLVSAKPGVAVLVPGMVLAGLGWGAINVMATEVALTAVAPAQAGMAAGTLNVVRQVGLAAGIAAIGAVFQRGAGGTMAGGASDAFLVAASFTAVAAVAVAALGDGRRHAGPLAARRGVLRRAAS